jgi:deazaflavin-dependent oxidoreductase (nitroreductase family)
MTEEDIEARRARMSRMPDTAWLSLHERALAKFDESGSTESLTMEVEGQTRPVIVVTARGAKTGQPRRVALMRVEADGTYAVVAAKGGSLTPPVWYHNLTANPEIQLQDRLTVGDFRAREVIGDERAMWWKRAVEVHPQFEDYAIKAERLLPILVLEPTSEGEPV